MALSISHRPPPAGKPLDCLAARLSRQQRRHRHPHHQAGAHGRHRRAVGAERPADPVREHRREAGLPAVRHPGEEPPLAGARARDDAGELSAHARLPAAPAAARLQAGQDRPGEGGGEAPQRGRLDRAADPVPQGQGRGALRHRDEHHPRSRDRLLQFLPRRHPCGRAAARADQLRHPALPRHHEQVPRDGHGRDADRLRVRRAAGLRDHGELLRPAHGHAWGEMEMVGTIMDRDIEMVPCETLELNVPAQAEIVVEAQRQSQGPVQGRRRHLALDVPPAAFREPAGGRDHRHHHARRPADLPQPPDLARHRPSAAAAALPRGRALQPAQRDRPRRRRTCASRPGARRCPASCSSTIRARAWSTTR